MRPREIQARIRAGASVEQVAAAAGVPLQRIERFAYPVLLERSRTSDMARLAHPVREDGPDLRTLDEVVEHTFGLRGQSYDQAEWDSFRGEDNKWVVALSWSVGRSDITARWTYHPGAHGGTVTALDEHATDLVDGHLSRPPRRVGPVIDFSKPEEGEGAPTAPAERPEAPAKAPQTSGNAVDRAAERVTARNAERASASTSDRATGTDPAAGRRATKTTTGSGTRAARAKAAQAEAGTSRGSAGAASGAGRSTSGNAGTSGAAAGTESADPAAAAKRPHRKAKPVMPSWEDVLLGVKRN